MDYYSLPSRLPSVSSTGPAASVGQLLAESKATGNAARAEFLELLIAATGAPPVTEVGLTWLLQASHVLEQVRHSFLDKENRQGLWQVQLNWVRRHVAGTLMTDPVLRAMPLRERVTMTEAALFGPASSKQFPQLESYRLHDHGEKVRVSPGLRGELRHYEKIFCLGDLLTHDLPPLSEPGFVAEFLGLPAKHAFGRALKYHRQCSHLTLAGLAKLARMPGSNPACKLSQWESGIVPMRGQEPLVSSLATALRCPEEELLSAYEATIVAGDANPFRRRYDLDTRASWTPELQGQFDQLLKEAEAAPHKCRAGSGPKHVEANLAENSVRRFEQDLRSVIAFLRLPQDAADPRFRGLGYTPGSFTLFDLGQLECHEGWLDWFCHRNGHDMPGRSMSGVLSKFAHYFLPQTGCMWLCASAFVANAATVNRCPTHWPKGSDFEGRACANATERLRAQCYLAHGSLRKLARQARDGAPSTKHLAELSEVMRRHPRPAVGLVVFLRRVWSSVPDPQNPRGAQELARLQFGALLALHLWRPVRPGELEKITVDHVWVDNDGRGWCALPPPGKNRHSEAARQGRSEFPPELVPFLATYLEVARPHLARGNCRALFPVPDRSAKNDKALPMSDEAFRDRLDRYVVEFAADLFPLGLRPHLLRHIVATDLFVRFGFSAGVELAARALRNSTIAVKKHYLFLTETKAPTDTKDPTHSMAVAATFGEATSLVQQSARTA